MQQKADRSRMESHQSATTVVHMLENKDGEVYLPAIGLPLHVVQFPVGVGEQEVVLEIVLNFEIKNEVTVIRIGVTPFCSNRVRA